MRTTDLAQILKDRYRNAPKGLAVTSIHLFGIEFAAELEGQPIKDICLRAGLPVSYHTEIHKGIRLAQFVRVKP